jgi:hypothetical protein
MGRIRTVKPEAFEHEVLFDAEKETGLPLRLAYIGLWTQCDRAGRFLWRPRQLKTNVLPYDDVDFSRVLDALWTYGFLVKYASDGNTYGSIPSWHKHQFINNKEKESELPEVSKENIVLIEQSDASATRGDRVPHAPFPSPSFPTSPSPSVPIEEAFEFFNLNAKAIGLPEARVLTPGRRTKLRERLVEHGIDGWREAVEAIPCQPFLLGKNDRGWVANFDFLLQPESLNKVRERAYLGTEIQPKPPPPTRTQIAINNLRERAQHGNSRPAIRNGSGALPAIEFSPASPGPGGLRGAIDSTMHREAEDVASEDG